MLIEVQPSKQINGTQLSQVLGSLGQVLSDYAQKPSYRELLSTLRVRLDWVQYKQNFRPPVAERVILLADQSTIRQREISINLRQVDVENVAPLVCQYLDRWEHAPTRSLITTSKDFPQNVGAKASPT